MKKVNIIIGRFQPFTKGHYKCVEEAWRVKNLPTIICMIDTPESKLDEKHPFTSEMLIDLYGDMFEKDKLIEKIVLIKSADIVKIAEVIGDKYQVAALTCGTDRVEDYSRFAKYKEQAHLADDFEIIEVKRSDEDVSATKARQALLDDDRMGFLKLIPMVPLSTRLKNDVFAILREQILKVVK